MTCAHGVCFYLFRKLYLDSLKGTISPEWGTDREKEKTVRQTQERKGGSEDGGKERDQV